MQKPKTASPAPPDTGVRVILVTFPTIEGARQVGTHLIQDQLAACVNLVPSVESIYQWQGELQCDAEVLAVFKTSTDRIEALQEAIQRLHPYDVPEFLVLPVEAGSPGYLRWVLEESKA